MKIKAPLLKEYLSGVVQITLKSSTIEWQRPAVALVTPYLLNNNIKLSFNANSFSFHKRADAIQSASSLPEETPEYVHPFPPLIVEDVLFSTANRLQ